MTKYGQVLSRELDLYAEFWAIVREGQEVPEPQLEPKPRFVVLSNMPGYMPEDDDPATFVTRDEAWVYLTGEVQRYVDHMEEVGYEPTVNSIPAANYVEVEDGGLGRVFYIDSLEDCD